MFILKVLMPMGEVFVCSHDKQSLLAFDKHISCAPLPQEHRINGNRESTVAEMAIEFTPNQPAAEGTNPAGNKEQ